MNIIEIFSSKCCWASIFWSPLSTISSICSHYFFSESFIYFNNFLCLIFFSCVSKRLVSNWLKNSITSYLSHLSTFQFSSSMISVKTNSGYVAWLLPSHLSIPSFIPFPHFFQIGLNRSCPETDFFS